MRMAPSALLCMSSAKKSRTGQTYWLNTCTRRWLQIYWRVCRRNPVGIWTQIRNVNANWGKRECLAFCRLERHTASQKLFDFFHAPPYIARCTRVFVWGFFIKRDCVIVLAFVRWQEQQQREHEDDMRARLRRSESIEKAAVSVCLGCTLIGVAQNNILSCFYSSGSLPTHSLSRSWHFLIFRRQRRWCPSAPWTLGSSFGSCRHRHRRAPPALDPPAEVRPHRLREPISLQKCIFFLFIGFICRQTIQALPAQPDGHSLHLLKSGGGQAAFAAQLTSGLSLLPHPNLSHFPCHIPPS